ncbi:transporter substrate-binding domain-containing protein [Sediminicoccus sp. KRV36]|uniref:transporter substrate-binding domain-containing protein n=1 Tax=Sediminicoccus sp. KRV36 TaxID=3133721 RepID=UPI00200E0926|nr:transporter substrate-binding domain-containing protein [Sediminicoccus rosea]UPY38680.1 transporter substrate-binding domain-containing protein [Sediminicoccus rosea]
MRAGPLLALALLVLALNPGGAAAQPSPPTLTVATGEAPPFVLRRGDALAGFSMDLWNAIAERMRVTSRFVDLGRRSDDAQIEAVRRGEADVAISAITMTPAREQLADFTLPYFDSGLQIAVRPDGDDGGWPGLSFLRALPWSAIGDLVLGGALILLLLAHVLWLVERRGNPRFQRGYPRGVAEGLWGVILIIATGEHGDRDESRLGKRLTIALMWLFGVVLIAQFTATVTSSLTVQQMQSAIRGPEDLPGKSIITAPGGTAEAWLRERGLPYRVITSAEEALRLLRAGQAQAIVYEAPTLRYWARVFGPSEVTLVGPVFRPEKYGIAVAADNPLRKRINTALLELYAEGRYDEIYRRWFSDLP